MPDVTCPKPEQLQELLAGQLAQSEHDTLSQHVDGCASCQRTLDGLAASSWEGKARRLGSEPPSTEAGVEHVIRSALDQPTQADTSRTGRAGGDDWSYLTPSATPGRLGRLGHYEIIELLGQGGFGTVFKGFDEKLHRIVAIKVLSPAFAANGSARQRFIREARTAAAVKNEHVVAIHTVEDEAQPPYLVMEIIDGLSLQDKLDKKGPLALREILRIGLQTAEGLAAAHKQGLVHRDIKPANILLENGVERVKITDFGLARAVDDASVTQSGTVAGTPMYMSPEQAEGLQIDHRSDLFSLGTVLYAVCTGHPPFRASGTHAVLKRVIDAAPRPIREINNEVPDWLCDIIARLHAKQPADRFQTAKEVAELLGQRLADVQAGRAIEGQAEDRKVPVQAPATAVINRPITAHGSQRTLLLSGVGALSLLMGVGLCVWLAVVSGQIRQSRFQEFAVFAGALLVHGLVFSATAHLMHRPRGRVFGFIALLIAGCIAPIILIFNVFTETNHWPVLIPFVLGLPVALWTIGILLRDGVLGLPLGGTVHQPRRRWAVAVGVIALLVAGVFTAPLLYRYLTNQGTLIYSGSMDPNLEKILIKRDGQAVADLITSNGIVRLPAGDYEAEVVGREGYELAKYRVGPFSLLGDSPDALGWRDAAGGTFPLTLTRDFHVGISLKLAKLPVDPSNTLKEEPPWVQLFNGKDLTGWKTHPEQAGAWNVATGELVGSTGAGPITHLYTTRGDFTNFHLRAEVKINKDGDSGIHFHCTPYPEFDLTALKGRGKQPLGYEANIGKSSRTTGGFGSIWRLDQQGKVLHKRGDDAPVEPNTWFLLEIVMKENHIVTKVDGKIVEDFHDAAGGPAKGHFALQAVNSPTRVRFKKIEIKELPAEEPGWVQLFNGKDLTGWKTNTGKLDNWIIQDKILVGAGKTSSLLMTERDDFQNFHYRVEAKINQTGESGQYFRTMGGWGPAAGGYEAQISVANATPSGKTGSLSLFKSKVWSTLRKIDREVVAANTWFIQEVIADGKHLTVKINGEIVATVEDSAYNRGHLALEFKGPDTVVHFKRIEIKELPPEEPGWVQLFNGKNLSGWKPHSNWRVEKGILAASGEIGNKNSAFLISERSDFADCHLRAEVRVLGDDSDSGIYVRSHKVGTSVHSFCEGQICSDPKRKLAQSGSIGIRRIDQKDIDPWISAPTGLTKTNEWFLLEVIAVGQKVTTKVNGRTTAQADITGVSKQGNVVLQQFGPQTRVEFKKIEIKELPPEEPAWVQLFNGKDLTGWKAHPDKPGQWRVENNILVGDGPPSHLFSQRGDYENFHLRAVAKINKGGNSGILFRSKFGHDFELRHGKLGIKMPAGLEVELASASEFPTGTMLRLGPAFASYKAETKPTPHDTWFTLEIIARGKRVITMVDGQRATDVELPDPVQQKGHVALQVHITPGTVVQFKSIEIKELPPSAAPPLALVPFDAKKAKEHQDAWVGHLGLGIEFKNAIGMSMRLIPPGEFTMGLPQEEVEKLLPMTPEHAQEPFKSEAPPRRVKIEQPFYLGVHEVTVGAFRKFVKATDYKTTAETNGKGGLFYNHETKKMDYDPKLDLKVGPQGP